MKLSDLVLGGAAPVLSATDAEVKYLNFENFHRLRRDGRHLGCIGCRLWTPCQIQMYSDSFSFFEILI